MNDYMNKTSISNLGAEESKSSRSPNLVCVSWHSTLPQHTGSNVRIRNILLNFKEITPILIAPEPIDLAFQYLPIQPFTVPQFLNKVVPFNLEILGCLGRDVADRAFELVKDLEVSGVQCEHLWSFPLAIKLAQHMQVPLILIEHNVETLYTQRTYGNRIVTKLTSWYEQRALEKTDRIVVCSEHDQIYLVEKFGVPLDRIWVVPNGVSLPDGSGKYDHQTILDDFADYKIILFLGKTSYSPNAEAISIIESEIIPRVTETKSKVLFVIVGGPRKRDLTRLKDGIVYTGFVASVQPYLERADICIAPLQSGSGTRLKILEYAAHRKPIVATKVAVEGLDFLDGEDLLIRNDWECFSNAILFLLNEREYAQKIGDTAYSKVEKKFQWQLIAQNYEKQLLGVLGSNSERLAITDVRKS